jgi:membrane-associated phospholipid phosphatase
MQLKKVNSFSVPPLAFKRKFRHTFPLFFLIFFIAVSVTLAQTPSASPQPSPAIQTARKPSLERHFFTNILKDQRDIWTSPLKLRKNDLRWFVPLGVATGALIATDRRTPGWLDDNKTRINVSRDVSRLGEGYAVGGAAAAFYLIGKATGNAREKETGLLAAEAFIDGGIVAQALKFATQRQRPPDGGGSGHFFHGGNSFPSGHSVTAWSFASVVDGEYGKRHPLVRYGVYGLAAAVSLSRYTGRKHFLSDVLVGSAIGYGIGHYVFLRRHDTDLDSPDKTKKTTKMQKYFPLIAPQYDARKRIYAATLAWNF